MEPHQPSDRAGAIRALEQRDPGPERSPTTAARAEQPVAVPPAEVTLLQRQVRATELALERARSGAELAAGQAEALAARLSEIERDLDEARREPERLRALLSRQELATRRAEQRLHAEQALHEELENEIETLDRRLEDARERIRALEGEVESQRRLVDEADHTATVAQAARRHAERRLRQQGSIRIGAAMRAEIQALAAAPGASDPAYGTAARRLRVVDALEREWAMRAAREAATSAWPSAELAQARGELAAHREAWAAVDEARARLRDAEPSSSGGPERSSHSAAPDAQAGPAAAGGAVEPGRLEQARARLRDRAPAPPAEHPAAEQPGAEQLAAEQPTGERVAVQGGEWLPRALRRLAGDDPVAAGRALVALLATQHLAFGEPVAYDLKLAERGWIAVTADPAAARTRVESLPGPRPVAERAFVVEGDVAGFARLILLPRPLLRRHLAAADGRRRAPAPLRAIARAPRTIAELRASDVKLEPADALRLLAAAVDPRWTQGERFTIGWELGPAAAGRRAYLQVRDGQRPTVAESAPRTAVSATVVCAPELLPSVLAGDSDAASAVHGEPRSLEVVERLIARLQGSPGDR